LARVSVVIISTSLESVDGPLFVCALCASLSCRRFPRYFNPSLTGSSNKYPCSYLGSGCTVTSSSPGPMDTQHGPHNMHGLSPSRPSPTTACTAGTFWQARQLSSPGGVMCSVSG
jgi:hypothetical protein